MTGALALLLAAPAPAVHWPQQGGDVGRSGYQPVGDGAAPVRPLWSAPGDIVTAPLISAGSLGDQRVVYGTADGRLHLVDLATGRERGAHGGTAIDDTLGAGVFGDPARGGGVAFTESSGSGGFGWIFAVHNADNRHPFLGGIDDVEVAVVDEATGGIVADQPVPGTVDHRVHGPAVLSPPNAEGDRSLLFLTEAPGGAVSLVRVAVERDGRLGAATAVAVPGADRRAGPAVVYLRASGRHREPELFAAVGAGDGVRTFSLERFPDEGPRSTQGVASYGTPAAPVAVAGLTPGQRGSGADSTPSLFVTASEGGTARVHRLEPEGDVLAVRASSPPLAGAAAPALTVAQEVIAGDAAAGWIVAGTTQDLHVLDARSLQPTAKVGGSGHGHSVAAAAGRIAFAARDDGPPLAVDLGTGQALAGAGYTPQEPHAGSRRPAGQPAISRGIVIFASDRGVFAYRTRCGNAMAGTGRADRLLGGVTGDAISGYAGRDALAGGDGDDCIDGGDGDDRVRGEAGEDTLAGGDGDDLAAGAQGPDQLAGGPGADRLDGGAGADVLLGGDGRDILLGGDGADRLAGGRHADRLDGGDGDDRLTTRGGGRDRVRCGPGRDVVLVDREDSVLPDCERVLRR